MIRTIVDTYAEADSYGFPLGTEWNGWVDAYEWAWQELDKRYAVREVTSLDELLRRASQRSYHDGREHCVRELKGGLAGLYFLARLWSSPEVLPRSRKPDARLVVYEPAEELFPILSRVLPENAELVIVLDYNPTRVLRKRGVLATVPAEKLPTTLVLTLHDDSVGLLPLLTTSALHQLVSDMRQWGLSGFCTRQWLISDHDPSVAYLSKAAWNRDATPQAVWADQIRATCGEAAVEPMLAAFREIESVTTGLEDHGMGLTFPWPGMMMQHWTPEPLTKMRPEDRAGYQRALDAMQRVPLPVRPEGQACVKYWIGRLEFAVKYLDAVQAVKAAAIAERAALDAQAKGDLPAYRARWAEALQQTEAAQAAAAQGIESFASVANRADLGAIAVLAEYVYRPLTNKVRELRM